MTSVSKKSSKELHLKNNLNKTEIPKERYVSPQKGQQIIDQLRLI